MKSQKIYEAAGWLGVILVLSSYALLSLGVINGSSVIYHLLILFGSLTIAAISIKKKVLQPAVLNIVFGVLAIIALARLAFFN